MFTSASLSSPVIVRLMVLLMKAARSVPLMRRGAGLLHLPGDQVTSLPAALCSRPACHVLSRLQDSPGGACIFMLGGSTLLRRADILGIY